MKRAWIEPRHRGEHLVPNQEQDKNPSALLPGRDLGAGVLPEGKRNADVAACRTPLESE